MYSNLLIINILKYLNNNINNNVEVNSLEDLFNYNKFYIIRLFKRELGLTIKEYLNKIRIYNSLELVVNPNYSCLKVALESGFTSLEYYSEVFRKIIGISPLKYRQFYLKNTYLNDDLRNMVINNVISLNDLKEKIEFYIRNTKPKVMVKVKKIYFK